MELPQTQEQPVNHFMRWIVLTGLFFTALLLSQVVMVFMMLPFVNFNEIDLENLIDYTDSALTPVLKWGQAVAAVISFILPAWLYTRITGQSFLSSSGMNKLPPLKASLLLPLLVVSALPFIAWTAEINKLVPLPGMLMDMEREAERITEIFLAGTSAMDLIVNILIIAVMAAVAEEIMFRGILQNLFMQWTKNLHLAVWISAAVFSFTHFQFHGFLPRMLLGAVMGYTFAWTGSLWMPILAHFINNFLGVLLHFLVRKGVVNAEAETYGSQLSDWPGIVTGTVLGLIFLFGIKKLTSASAGSGIPPRQ